MTFDPNEPYRPYEYPPLYEASQQSDSPPMDYPADAALPPSPYPDYGGYPYAPAQYDPYRPTTPQGTNGLATAALVVSLVSFALCGATSIISLILGIIAMRDTKRSGQDGFGIAVAGVIISVIPLLLWLLYWVFFAWLLTSGWSLV